MKLRWPWKKKPLTYCDCPVGMCLGNGMERCAFRRVNSSNNFYRLNDKLWHHLEMRDGLLYYDGMKMIVALDQVQFSNFAAETKAKEAKRVIDNVKRRDN